MAERYHQHQALAIPETWRYMGIRSAKARLLCCRSEQDGFLRMARQETLGHLWCVPCGWARLRAVCPEHGDLCAFCRETTISGQACLDLDESHPRVHDLQNTLLLVPGEPTFQLLLRWSILQKTWAQAWYENRMRLLAQRWGTSPHMRRTLQHALDGRRALGSAGTRRGAPVMPEIWADH